MEFFNNYDKPLNYTSEPVVNDDFDYNAMVPEEMIVPFLAERARITEDEFLKKMALEHAEHAYIHARKEAIFLFKQKNILDPSEGELDKLAEKIMYARLDVVH